MTKVDELMQILANDFTATTYGASQNFREALEAALADPEQETVSIGTEWIPCMKLPVVVHVRNQRQGENHVSTREGITPVKPDDLIMRGVSGEEYPIGRAIFEQTYTFDVKVNTHPATPLREEQIHNADPAPHIMSDAHRIEFARALEWLHNIGEKK